MHASEVHVALGHGLLGFGLVLEVSLLRFHRRLLELLGVSGHCGVLHPGQRGLEKGESWKAAKEGTAACLELAACCREKLDKDPFSIISLYSILH